jgi:hypothetical protein
MKRIILILFFTSLVFINCNPNNGCEDCPDPNIPPPKDTIYFPQEFLDYVYFNEGSWWIYQRIDTSEKVYDTVEVERASIKIYFIPQKSTIHAIEQGESKFTHSNNSFFKSNIAPKDRWQIFSSDVYDSNRFVAHCDSYSPLAWGYYFTWPYRMGLNDGDWTLLDTFHINVVNKQRPTLHVALGSSSTEIWLCSKIGIVKFKTYTNQIWELNDYYIKQ